MRKGKSCEELWAEGLKCFACFAGDETLLAWFPDKKTAWEKLTEFAKDKPYIHLDTLREVHTVGEISAINCTNIHGTAEMARNRRMIDDGTYTPEKGLAPL